LIAFHSIPPIANIYDEQGKILNTIRFSNQSVNKKLVSLSYETIGLIDSANPILKVNDSKNNKTLLQYEHNSDILEISLNNISNPNERKILIFDSNKDLYIFFPIKNISMKIASMVNSFKWHENLDVFVYSCNQKTYCVYQVESILLDKELFELCSQNIPTPNNPDI